MPDNSIAKIDLDPNSQTLSISIGNLSNQSMIGMFEKVSETIKSSAGNLWEPIKAELEIRKLKQILDNFDLTIEDINWSSVTEITVLEILKAAVQSNHLNPNTTDMVKQAWGKIFDLLKKKENSLLIDKIIEYTSILNSLNNKELETLKALYINHTFADTYDYSLSVINKLSDLNLLAYNSGVTAGPVIGKQYLSNIQQIKLIASNYEIRVFRNDQTLEFTQFIFNGNN